MLAKAIAAEATASFFNMSGSDFVELYAHAQGSGMG